MVICLERSANDLHMVWLMPLQPHHLCFSKIQSGLSFWYQHTQVVLEKRPLNDCLCVLVGLGLRLMLGYWVSAGVSRASRPVPRSIPTHIICFVSVCFSDSKCDRCSMS